MSKTCMQQRLGRDGRLVARRLPHDVPDRTGDPNNGYALCASCGQSVYVGTGLHPNLGVPLADVDAELRYLRENGKYR